MATYAVMILPVLPQKGLQQFTQGMIREYPNISRTVGHSFDVYTPEDMKYFCSSSMKIETYRAQVKHGL